ncbi:Sec-independent protein translocase subunit TatA/TatB [Bacteroides mediterraneensis]|uniref:Sec-independent protein translocase subunit TatA/TatB n=1 Tax=Bacteroides mediterraneensis TaxID=1841856 RepID=UPI0009337C76|nr:twin-arginine translocase TatA/TatE family subunit [Bacteroides mediterraneensis]
MNTTLLLMGIGTQEFLFIILIILILFGGKKIPELMKGLGKGVKSFKEGMNEVEENLKETDSKKEEVSSTDHKEK